MAKLKILRRRLSECNVYWGPSRRDKCEPDRKNFEENQIRWYVKCKYQSINYLNIVVLYLDAFMSIPLLCIILTPKLKGNKKLTKCVRCLYNIASYYIYL